MDEEMTSTPVALPMWKMFYNPIVALFKNLSNSVCDLESLISSILNSKSEFSEIFIPRFDTDTNTLEFQVLEQKYFLFTVWLQGRLLYLLSLKELQRIHHISIEAQLKILGIIKLYQPHLYRKICFEYINCFKSLISYVTNNHNNELIIKQFCCDKNVDGLNLESIYIQTDSLETCVILIKYLIEINSYIFSNELDCSVNNEIITQIEKMFYIILETLDINIKVPVLSAFTEFFKNNCLKPCDISHNSDKKYIKFLPYLESVVFNYTYKDLSKKELIKLSSVLCDHFTFLYKYVERENINMDVRLLKIALYIVTGEKYDSNGIKMKIYKKQFNDEIKNICCTYVKSKLECNSDLLDYARPWIDNIKDVFVCENMNRLLEYKIKYEIINYVESICKEKYVDINVYEISPTWGILHDKLQNLLKSEPEMNHFINNIEKINQILRIREFVNIEITFHLQEFGYKVNYLSDSVQIVRYIVNQLKEFPTNENLDEKYFLSIVSIFSGILTITENKSIPYTEKSWMENTIASILSIPLKDSSKDNPEIDIIFEQLQITDIRNSDKVKTECLKALTNNLKIHKFMNSPLITNYNEIVQKQILTIAPFLIANDSIIPHKIIAIILYPIMKMKNINLSIKLSEILLNICCVLGGRYVILKKISKDYEIYEEIICFHCDNEEKKQKICSKMYTSKDNYFESMETILLPFLKLFKSDSPIVRRNMVLLLPKLAKHMPRFYSVDVLQEWIVCMSDNDYTVRKNLADVIKELLLSIQNNPNIENGLKENLYQICIDSVIKSTDACLDCPNQKFQETVLSTVKILSCLKIKNYLLTCIRLLIYFIMNDDSNVTLIAGLHFNKISEQLGFYENELYCNYKKDICRTVIDLCVINFVSNGTRLSTSLRKIALIFGFNGSRDLIINNCQHLIPYLIPWNIKIPSTVSLLGDIADVMGIETSELITSQFFCIYPYVYLYQPDEIYKKCVKFIENTTSSNLSTLKKLHFRVIHNELLLHYHYNADKVLAGLKLLSKEDPENSNITLRNSQQFANFIQPRFLGVLVYFDSKLVRKRVALSVKRKALQSLPLIIKLMGSEHITPLRYKVLATLRTALTLLDGEFPKLGCLAWEAFIKSCEITYLGPLLSTIFVSLLPLLKMCPSIVNDIFHYLVIENESNVENHIQDLFFVTETDLNNDIKSVVSKYMERNQPKSFKEQLMFYLKYINHENVEVKTFGVKFLTRLLEKNRKKLDSFILGNNGLNPVIVELLDLLTTGCREKEVSFQLACGECIGEIGAIEPSHLPQKYTETDQSFTFSVRNDTFVFNALNELTRAFQSEKYSQNMDCFALAMQEILKAYNISPDSSSESGKALWEKLPDNQKQILSPLLSSRYKIAISGDSPLNIHPIYGSSSVVSFADWLNSWINKLIQYIENEQARNLFQYCRPSLKKDLRTLMFFLPYILMHALVDCSFENQHQIFEEMMAVLKSQETKKEIKQHHLEYCSIKSDTLKYIPKSQSTEDASQVKSSKVVYILLDFLTRWMHEWRYSNCPKKSPVNDPEYSKINDFMNKFCKLTIAKSNYKCNEYSRALIFLEDYVNGYNGEFMNQLGFFSRIYAQLEDADNVAGIRVVQQTEPSLDELILAHEISGQLQDAAACYERMAQEQNLKPHIIQGMIRCYLDLDSPSTASNIAEGLICSHPEYSDFLYECQAEPLWRLGQYDKLEKLLEQPKLKNNSSWGVQIGRSLLHFCKDEQELFFNEISSTCKDLVNCLGAATLEDAAYQHGYPQIIKLHILNELKKANHLVKNIRDSAYNDSYSEKYIKDLVGEWELRSELVQSSVRTLEPILCLRRIALQQAKNLLSPHSNKVAELINLQIGKSWLESARVARNACAYQQAYVYLLKAEKYNLKELFIEKAKLHWKRGDQDTAFNTLKRGLEEHYPDVSIFKNTKSEELLEDRKLCAEAKLLIASYNEETANLDMESNIQKYKEAIEVYKEWEMTMVHCGQYYDKVLSTLSVDRDIGIGCDIQMYMINYFGKSLQFGCHHIYQSMPRMLSIWLDYGTRILESKNKDNYNIKHKNLMKMTTLISTYTERLPSYMFLSAFSQIVSRICHPQEEVYRQLKSIIVSLILSYPQQSLWMLMSVSKSSYATRVTRCQEILRDERLRSVPRINALIKDFNRLGEKLIELCNIHIAPAISVASVSSLLKTLPRLLTGKDFCQIMMPVQKFRKMVLPSVGSSLNDHDPFPNNMVYITGIADEMHILQSLQRPRKITLKGSDGKKYIHMLKPKDDLRKDFRLMEFNDIVNQYLHKEAESRERRLCIRTYSVVPLNEECGLIEWVPNLVGLRPILISIYKQKGLHMATAELKKCICDVKDSTAKKKKIFMENLLPRHPPVFSDWFRHKFSDPFSWYQARTAYIRTTAVMSMVGYILGLGDRHGENILFDSTTGDTVHVDFNCLFNKGETFEWPELVPFRLTQNMIKAMGPLGVEGAYRKSCEITLRVLRTQKDTLMSVVKPFVYDPLVKWSQNPIMKKDATAERMNEQAVDHVRNIETRLQGIKSGGKLPLSLSVEGHVNSLIKDATSIDNLCQMYIGWGPYL